jgi:hypothetical protein
MVPGMSTDTLRRLEPLVGTWRMEASFEGAIPGRAVFEWALDGHFLVERAEVTGAPDSIALMGAAADGGYVQHYFDSRGVARVYAMTFDGSVWTLLRVAADFTPLDFAQRFVGELDEEGGTIRGRWETSDDGTSWTRDFDLTYVRER